MSAFYFYATQIGWQSGGVFRGKSLHFTIRRFALITPLGFVALKDTHTHSHSKWIDSWVCEIISFSKSIDQSAKRKENNNVMEYFSKRREKNHQSMDMRAFAFQCVINVRKDKWHWLKKRSHPVFTTIKHVTILSTSLTTAAAAEATANKWRKQIAWVVVFYCFYVSLSLSLSCYSFFSLSPFDMHVMNVVSFDFNAKLLNR